MTGTILQNRPVLKFIRSVRIFYEVLDLLWHDMNGLFILKYLLYVPGTYEY